MPVSLHLKNGTITLTVKELPQKHSGHAVYRIAVADAGIGISPEFLPKLFLPLKGREAGIKIRRREPDWVLLSLKYHSGDGGGQIYGKPFGEGSVFTVEVELRFQGSG